jgi:hypothetical protein
VGLLVAVTEADVLPIGDAVKVLEGVAVPERVKVPVGVVVAVRLALGVGVEDGQVLVKAVDNGIAAR